MKRLIATSPAVLGGIAAVTLVAGAGAAIAAWRVQSDEVVLTAETATLSPGNKPSVTAAGKPAPSPGSPTRSASARSTAIASCGTTWAAPRNSRTAAARRTWPRILGDTGVPTGSWRYTVVPVKGGWTGPESAKSDAVIVAADGKAVVVPDPAVAKTAGPAAGPAVVAIGDPATPGDPAASLPPDSPPAWTLQPGADGVLGTDDTLTYAGGSPIDPNAIVNGWNGAARPVAVVAKAGQQPVLTVDDGTTRVFGPLAVPGTTVPADVTFAATLAAVQGRIVVTLGAVQVAPAPDEAATAPTEVPTTAPAETPGTPSTGTPGTETADPSEPAGTPSTTESAGGAGDGAGDGQPAGGDQPPAGGDTGGPVGDGGTEDEPAAPATPTGVTDASPTAEVTPSTAGGDAAVVLVAA